MFYILHENKLLFKVVKGILPVRKCFFFSNEPYESINKLDNKTTNLSFINCCELYLNEIWDKKNQGIVFFKDDPKFISAATLFDLEKSFVQKDLEVTNYYIYASKRLLFKTKTLKNLNVRKIKLSECDFKIGPISNFFDQICNHN